jgi:hypothetical protein
MERQVERSQKLAATVLSVDELGILWKLCIDHFGDDQFVITRLIVKVSGERLTFESLDQFSACSDLPDRLYDYRLWTYKTIAHGISIHSVLGTPVVVASGPNVAWCAGAVDMVATFAKNRRQWYSWFSSAPLFRLALGMGVLGLFVIQDADVPVLTVIAQPPPAVAGWLAALSALSFLSAMRARAFPRLAIRVCERRGYIQKYVGELGLLFTVLSFVAAVISIYISLRPAH